MTVSCSPIWLNHGVCEGLLSSNNKGHYITIKPLVVFEVRQRLWALFWYRLLLYLLMTHGRSTHRQKADKHSKKTPKLALRHPVLTLCESEDELRWQMIKQVKLHLICFSGLKL